MRLQFLAAWLIWLAASRTSLPAAEAVNESSREIPVAADVDVVVVGGSSAAVAAAVAAAEDGRRVFLAAPHPYLGEDMTATLRLWLEEGEVPESPLATRVFSDPADGELDPNRRLFTYAADTPSMPPHTDLTPPRLLADGRWNNPSSESVQYERNVCLTCDLNAPQAVREVRLRGFRRPQGAEGGTGFDVGRITAEWSVDGEQWMQAVASDSPALDADRFNWTAAVDAQPRYVRLQIALAKGFTRMLLGEIELIGPPQALATPSPARPPRPMHVKKTLDDCLLAAGVQYLYGCLATDVLRDGSGQPCGIVMANRAGRQAVIAKAIIDATPRAVVARIAGAAFHPFAGGTQTFKRVVIGGEPRTADYITSRIAAPPFRGSSSGAVGASGATYPVIEYTLPLHRDDASYGALMRVDQLARSLTYHPDQQYTSDVLFEVPGDPVRSRQPAEGAWRGVGQVPLGAFQPAGVDRLYVLSGCAEVPREQAERLLRPLAFIDAGTRVGKAAAAEAAALPAVAGAALRGEPAPSPVADGHVLEPLQGPRPTGVYPTVSQSTRALPVLGRYDVVVVGGGTGGAPAGIGAARRGARTLVVETHYGLGGVGTLGAISGYYWGNRVGFTAQVLDGATRWPIEPKMEWYRQELLKAGAEIWFGAVGCGAFVENDRVRGVVVATPYGRGVVLAHTVVDATGNSDLAAAAGAACDYTDENELGMQGTGLPGRRLGESYNNTDFTIVDETDMVDVWHVLVYSKGKYEQSFDHGRLIDTRERRRIVGDFTISLADQINQRTYPDTVVRAWSNFDTHGYTIDPMLLIEHPEKKGIAVNIPWRAMLPRGLDGLVVTGLSISAHRDAVPLIRMQADVQNGGYAAGVAAAMAAQSGTTVRGIDLKELQRHLVEIGNLPETVLTDTDSYPLPDEQIATAVAQLPEGRGAAVVMTHPDRALPRIREAYRSATDEARLAYAKALAVLGDSEGLDSLLNAIREAESWDEGWNFRGMGQFGSALSPLDTLIVCVGHTRDAKALPPILEKAARLNAFSAFSHHRAVGLALESIGDPAAAPALAQLLSKPGMTGHVHASIDQAIEKGVPGGTNAENTRRESLRELVLARALFRCGDQGELGQRILEGYAGDLRGHLARHARAVLDAGR